MEFIAKTGELEKQSTACLAVAVGDKGALSPAAQQIDQLSDGMLSSLLKAGDIKGKAGQSLMLHRVPGVKAERVLLVGTGQCDTSISQADFLKAARAMASAIKQAACKELTLALCDQPVTDADDYWKARQLLQAVGEANYRFDQLKSERSKKPLPLRKVTLLASSRAQSTPLSSASEHAQAIVSGIHAARDLGNLPGNICTPSYLAKRAKGMAKKHSALSCKVLDEKQMRELGMHSLLSVSAGSAQGARLITLEYKGGKKSDQPIVLLGKGITFDSGGISLKPGAGMDEMKFDMCGAASVIGTMTTLCELKLPINVVGMIASAENMPGPTATKPGDIITSMSGKTIEVLNTDAEGRLVLCDALTYAERFKPAAVVDIATLTGACIVALGHHISGMMSNNDALAERLTRAGKRAADLVWQLPMNEDYQKQLDSNFADIANIGGPGGGTITAGCFLARFAEKFDWAHLDIAGTAWLSGQNKGATGRPVALLSQFLLDSLD
ncbi:leucyl aminopeptidase [Aestuariirhabdus litorea]|uniref:Probable cytosol aminopeptidase n=1 Tax=Aestuariirhabdus litorea TaxID=2528527 RepID=A0A3P3VSN1_9GAMM|nr:leucyl aminopeptidase [Aestuariirhabdus litorea]RRJ85327.1 leucyl aminopeptidase [Aestuariirhabdus litorea]RWW98549.1 leucyl aminopeptidase [Endozoicomonadaceae bacterium GTF-13]